MSKLSGLELRKALCVALGFRVLKSSVITDDYRVADGWTLHGSDQVPGRWLPREELAWQDLPAYESDANLSEELLEKVCRERGWIWYMWRDDAGICHCVILAKVNILRIASEEHSETSVALARCLLSALKGDR